MDNAELLTQIAALIEQSEERTSKRIQSLETEMKAMETRINLKIENDVAKRIDSLFDGYKLVHEKQWELEHKVEALEARLAKLEAIAG